MSSRPDRHAGVYLVGSFWHEGQGIVRYLRFRQSHEGLEVRSETVTAPLGRGFFARNAPEVAETTSAWRMLRPDGDGDYEAIGFPRRYRFLSGAIESDDAVEVLREGESSGPCPRCMVLPSEEPGRRSDAGWFDLGNPTLCMTLTQSEALPAFYERLGFERNASRPNVLISGWTVIGFLDFQYQPCINYRGPDIADTAFELARRGYRPTQGLVETPLVQGNGAGTVSLTDPGGHHLFFNTHLSERPTYAAWRSGNLAHERHAQAFNVGGTSEQNDQDHPPGLPLGELVACLGCRDLGASVAFYQGLGFDTLESSADAALLFSRPVRPNRFAFPVRLMRAVETGFSFGFLCDDVELCEREIRGRGIEMSSGDSGPVFTDPDGNVVTLFPAVQIPR